MITGFEFIDLILNGLNEIFGDPLLTAVIILGLLSVGLAIMKAPFTAILIINLLAVSGIVLNHTLTNFIDIPAYFIIIIFLMLGAIFTMFILFFLNR